MDEPRNDPLATLTEATHCPVCGHAWSMHNELRYCRSRSKGRGDCTCDGSTCHPSGARRGWVHG